MESRLAALRNKYSLLISRASLGDTPDILREYYRNSWDIEIHVLYQDAVESRRQWIFRDEEGTTRLAAVLTEPSEEEDSPDEPETPEDPDAPDDADADAETPEDPQGPVRSGLIGFIELYNAEGFLAGERQFFDDGEELSVSYMYTGQLLLRAETRRTSLPAPKPLTETTETAEAPDGEVPGDGDAAGIDPEPLTELAGAAQEVPVEPQGPPQAVERLVTTDYYRYSRAGSLRAIERVYHEQPAGDDGQTRLRFPHRILDSVDEEKFVDPALAYGSEYLSDIFIASLSRVVYNTDERGRILSETHLDDSGQVIGQLSNIWSGDRLIQVLWKAGDDERRVEYVYDDEGDRIEERNYQRGNLERIVLREGEIEVEELYMDGQLLLRARWEDGRKISEERIRPAAAGSTAGSTLGGTP
jgi:hypothetical protein